MKDAWITLRLYVARRPKPRRAFHTFHAATKRRHHDSSRLSFERSTAISGRFTGSSILDEAIGRHRVARKFAVRSLALSSLTTKSSTMQKRVCFGSWHTLARTARATRRKAASFIFDALEKQMHKIARSMLTHSASRERRGQAAFRIANTLSSVNIRLKRLAFCHKLKPNVIQATIRPLLKIQYQFSALYKEFLRLYRQNPRKQI